MSDLNELAKSEEAKRDRHIDPAERWRLIQNTITWAEQQATVRRNTKEACFAKQVRLLDSMAKIAALKKR